jgi:glycerophosphoryl diester phosphodiesterase
MPLTIFIGLIWASVFAAFGAENSGAPVPRTHAHNDYEHTRPLWDALEQGFCSVEADIYLVKGQLLVAHDFKDVKTERTLQKLYLDPLREVVNRNHGTVYPNGAKLVLLVDVKGEAEATYATLKPVLQQYAGILTRFRGGKLETNAVTVILSGNRPRETLLAENDRLAAYDGRLADLGKDLSVSFMPLVSDSFAERFPSARTGTLSETDRRDFERVIKQAHLEGKAIRFWATADDRASWKMLRNAGVDWINTDDLKGLANFLREQ